MLVLIKDLPMGSKFRLHSSHPTVWMKIVTLQQQTPSGPRDRNAVAIEIGTDDPRNPLGDIGFIPDHVEVELVS